MIYSFRALLKKIQPSPWLEGFFISTAYQCIWITSLHSVIQKPGYVAQEKSSQALGLKVFFISTAYQCIWITSLHSVIQNRGMLLKKIQPSPWLGGFFHFHCLPMHLDYLIAFGDPEPGYVAQENPAKPLAWRFFFHFLLLTNAFWITSLHSVIQKPGVCCSRKSSQALGLEVFSFPLLTNAFGLPHCIR